MNKLMINSYIVATIMMEKNGSEVRVNEIVKRNFGGQ